MRDCSKFDSLDVLREFAGENYEAAVVPDNARALLAYFDERSQHYEIRISIAATANQRNGKRRKVKNEILH